MTSTRRDHLVDTALALFQRHGFHATGIDRILAEAGVAKRTLYNHFKSKDELILAALRRRDETFRNQFMRAVERRARTPRGRLLALFDALEEWFASPTFAGCTFAKACAEYGARDDPIHAAAAEHKRLMTRYVRDLAAAAGAPRPEALAAALSLLIEGAVVTAHIGGSPAPARTARRAAATLLAAAGLPPDPAG